MDSSEDNTASSNARRSVKRKQVDKRQVLERMAALDGIIKAANSLIDPLSCFPSFRHYCKNGLSVHLDFRSGDKLSSHLKQYIKMLLKVNMKAAFGSDWPTEEKSKQKEMASPEARYIFVYDISMYASEENKHCSHDSGVIAGFLHYRFVVEEEVPVLYVYELQLESRIQGKGLGIFLMQLVELIAQKNRMVAVLLTVQKANPKAMKFYTDKLGYSISAISPSKFRHLTGVDANYEILCKILDDEAKHVLLEA